MPRLAILIVGLLKYDSGKTSVALSLVQEAIEKGMNVGVLKPISGFDAWSQYKYVLKSMEYGKLIGEDLYLLHATARSNAPIEVEGPLVMLLAPPDPASFSWRMSLYTTATTSTIDQAIIARITECSEGAISTRHYVIEENLERTPNVLKNKLIELIRKLEPKPRIIGREDVEENLFSYNSIEGIDSCVKRIMSSYDMVVIESYNDAAAPTPSSIEVDVVVAVAPGKIALYPGDKYRRALNLVGEIRNPLATTTSDILGLIKPIKAIDTHPVVNPKELEKPWIKGLLDEIAKIA